MLSCGVAGRHHLNCGPLVSALVNDQDLGQRPVNHWNNNPSGLRLYPPGRFRNVVMLVSEGSATHRRPAQPGSAHGLVHLVQVGGHRSPQPYPDRRQVLDGNHDLSRHAPLVQLAASWSATSVQWSSGPCQDQPPRIDPWAVSIANVLDGDAGEQEPE